MRKRNSTRPAIALASLVAAGAVLGGQLSTADAASSSLSGGWSGKYSGAYHGTFTLHWTQSGSKLNGTIRLSTSRGCSGSRAPCAGAASISGPSAGRGSHTPDRRRADRCRGGTRHRVGAAHGARTGSSLVSRGPRPGSPGAGLRAPQWLWKVSTMRSNGIAARSATSRTASAPPSNRHSTTSSTRIRIEPRYRTGSPARDTSSADAAARRSSAPRSSSVTPGQKHSATKWRRWCRPGRHAAEATADLDAT